ncbi:hypothetical protein SVAN01_10089, partial [Stagonosporopsis vannaccii]
SRESSWRERRERGGGAGFQDGRRAREPLAAAASWRLLVGLAAGPPPAHACSDARPVQRSRKAPVVDLGRRRACTTGKRRRSTAAALALSGSTRLPATALDFQQQHSTPAAARRPSPADPAVGRVPGLQRPEPWPRLTAASLPLALPSAPSPQRARARPSSSSHALPAIPCRHCALLQQCRQPAQAIVSRPGCNGAETAASTDTHRADCEIAQSPRDWRRRRAISALSDAALGRWVLLRLANGPAVGRNNVTKTTEGRRGHMDTTAATVLLADVTAPPP